MLGAVPRPHATRAMFARDLVRDGGQRTRRLILPDWPRLKHSVRPKQPTQPRPHRISYPPAPRPGDPGGGVRYFAHLAGTFSRRGLLGFGSVRTGSRRGSVRGSTTILLFGFPIGAIDGPPLLSTTQYSLSGLVFNAFASLA